MAGELFLGVQTQDLPTLRIAGVAASPINNAGLLAYFERGTDEVMRITNAEQILAMLGRFRSDYNGHYLVKGFFENLQGTPATLYVRRIITNNATAAVTVNDEGAGSTPTWIFKAGRFGKEDPGTWGNQLWVLNTLSSRSSGDVASSFIASYDGSVTPVTTVTMDSVAQFEIGDWVKVDGSTSSATYHQISAIDENLSTITFATGDATDRSGDATITVDVHDVTVKVYVKDSKTGNVDLVETWSNLSPDIDSPFYAATIINDEDIGSQYIKLEDQISGNPTDQDDFPNTVADDFANAVRLTGGTDGTAANANDMTNLLSDFDDYPILYLTNGESFSETIWDDGEQYCNVRKDCVWVGTPDWADAQATSSLTKWANKRRKSRKVYAMNNGTYYNVTDPLSTAPNPIKRIPNVGHMMGYSIWITSVRGIHKVPAGRLQVPVGIRSLANEIISKRDLRDLKNVGMNLQTTIDGEYPVRSARTPSKLKEHQFINSVLMSIFFKKSFEISFVNLENEPNKAGLLSNIARGMSNFALEFYKTSSNGGLEGGFAEGGFAEVVRIVADDSINPIQKINDGELRANFYFKAPPPMESLLIGVGLLFDG